jgi:hypothetical protein
MTNHEWPLFPVAATGLVPVVQRLRHYCPRDSGNPISSAEAVKPLGPAQGQRGHWGLLNDEAPAFAAGPSVAATANDINVSIIGAAVQVPVKVSKSRPLAVVPRGVL